MDSRACDAEAHEDIDGMAEPVGSIYIIASSTVSDEDMTAVNSITGLYSAPHHRIVAYFRPRSARRNLPSSCRRSSLLFLGVFAYATIPAYLTHLVQYSIISLRHPALASVSRQGLHDTRNTLRV